MNIVTEVHRLKYNVELRMDIQKVDGRTYDTKCSINGVWFVPGNRRNEFVEEMLDLLDKFSL